MHFFHIKWAAVHSRFSIDWNSSSREANYQCHHEPLVILRSFSWLVRCVVSSSRPKKALQAGSTEEKQQMAVSTWYLWELGKVWRGTNTALVFLLWPYVFTDAFLTTTNMRCWILQHFALYRDSQTWIETPMSLHCNRYSASSVSGRRSLHSSTSHIPIYSHPLMEIRPISALAISILSVR